jgi:hypothetical protein
LVCAAAIAADRKASADLDELNERAKLFDERLSVIFAVPLIPPAYHINLFDVKVFQPRARRWTTIDILHQWPFGSNRIYNDRYLSWFRKFVPRGLA